MLLHLVHVVLGEAKGLCLFGNKHGNFVGRWVVEAAAARHSINCQVDQKAQGAAQQGSVTGDKEFETDLSHCGKVQMTWAPPLLFFLPAWRRHCRVKKYDEVGECVL